MRNNSDTFKRYLGKFSKKISGNTPEILENCFGISWKNLGKFLEIFQKIWKNTAKILKKYFKNFESYCGGFGELFHKKILKIISAMFENHFKKFRHFSDIFEKYFRKY